MDFSGFIGKIVSIDLVSTTTYYYEGKVLEADSEFVRLIDKKGREVCVRVAEIKNIREVEK